MNPLIHHCHYCPASPPSWIILGRGSYDFQQHNSKHAQQATVEFFPFDSIKTSFSFGLSCKIIYAYLQGPVRAQIDQPWMEAILAGSRQDPGMALQG